MARLTKTLEYRRARFLDDRQNLEQLVRDAWARLPTQAERTVTFSDDRSICGLRAQDFHGRGFAVHCANYADGQGVGTIPTNPAPAVNVGERPPEPGENFLNSDFMALVKDNHVICMNCGRNAGSLRIYLQRLFRAERFPDASQQFELARIGSPDKIAIIEAVGVKSVDLKVKIFESTATAIGVGEGGNGPWRTITRCARETIAAVAARDQSVQQLRSAEKGTVTISINVPKGDLEMAKDSLDSFAEDLVEDEEADAFVINLRDGATIKPDEVSVRKQIRLEATANTVSVNQTWDEMST